MPATKLHRSRKRCRHRYRQQRGSQRCEDGVLMHSVFGRIGQQVQYQLP